MVVPFLLILWYLVALPKYGLSLHNAYLAAIIMVLLGVPMAILLLFSWRTRLIFGPAGLV
jgi:hypothetical protein